MRLFGLICNCHNSEQLIRSVFHEADLPNWLDIPVFKGNRAKEVANEFASKYTETPQPTILQRYLETHASYAIIVGYDPETQYVKWSDVALGDLPSKIEAIALSKRFAEK